MGYGTRVARRALETPGGSALSPGQDEAGHPELALLARPRGADGQGVLLLYRREESRWQAFAQEWTGLRPFAIATGDFDGDGRDDVVVGAQNSHHVNAWRSLEGGLARLPDLGAGRGVLDVELVDLDGDGRADLVVANNFSNDESVLRAR